LAATDRRLGDSYAGNVSENDFLPSMATSTICFDSGVTFYLRRKHASFARKHSMTEKRSAAFAFKNNGPTDPGARLLMGAVNARMFRERAFSMWRDVTCVLWFRVTMPQTALRRTSMPGDVLRSKGRMAICLRCPFSRWVVGQARRTPQVVGAFGDQAESAQVRGDRVREDLASELLVHGIVDDGLNDVVRVDSIVGAQGPDDVSTERGLYCLEK
jgi:hypothetical protein